MTQQSPTLWSSSQQLRIPSSQQLRMPSLDPYQASQAAAPLHSTVPTPSYTEVVFGVPLGEPASSGPGRQQRQSTTRRNTRQVRSAESRARLRNLHLKPMVVLMPLDVSNSPLLLIQRK